jgi:hypothetical protein
LLGEAENVGNPAREAVEAEDSRCDLNKCSIPPPFAKAGSTAITISARVAHQLRVSHHVFVGGFVGRLL